jgi:GT2 family glycosyltransferase
VALAEHAATRVAGAARPARLLFAPQSPRPLGPDAAADPARYRRWLADREHWRRTAAPEPAKGPVIDLLLVVDGAPGPDLARTFAALRAQTSGLWHLSVSVVGEPREGVEELLGTAVAALGPRRSTITTQPAGTHPADARAAALEETASPACAVLDPGDVLVPDAIAQLSAALVEADVAYGDEDRFDAAGRVERPVLKPDWSPELLLSWPYTGRPAAMRVAPLVAAGGIRRVAAGDWEHDVMLRVTERTERVAHVAEVLCHRPHTSGARESAGQPGAVADALARRHEAGEVTPGPVPGTWRVRRPVRGTPLVTAIVPFRDSTTLLRACADSLLARSSCAELELLLVDNGSTEPETATLLDRLSVHKEVTVLRDDRPFNWPVINNTAAATARGDVLLFVNDDVEARRDDWLDLLVAHAQRPGVGAVGARLVYPDGTLQHAGIVVGMTGVSGHVLAGLAPGRPGYLAMSMLTRDVSAVTGACMATAHETFDRLGGFDESLWLDFSDTDYCLRARRRGLRVVYEGGAELVHHESPTRGTSASDETAAAFVARWGPLLDAGDAFLNANLSRSDFSAGLDDPEPGGADPGVAA